MPSVLLNPTLEKHDSGGQNLVHRRLHTLIVLGRGLEVGKVPLRSEGLSCLAASGGARICLQAQVVGNSKAVHPVPNFGPYETSEK